MASLQVCTSRERAVPFRAQQGEDIILWNYFKRKKSGFFIEVGAFDGV